MWLHSFSRSAVVVATVAAAGATGWDATATADAWTTFAVADAFTLLVSPSHARAAATSRGRSSPSPFAGNTADADAATAESTSTSALRFTYQDTIEDPTREEEGEQDNAVLTTTTNTVPVSFYRTANSNSSSISSSNSSKNTNDESSSSPVSSSVSIQVERYNKMSVTELKRLLMDLNIDFRDCIEKRDLVERLLGNNSKTYEEGDDLGDEDDGEFDEYPSKKGGRSRSRKSRLMDSELSLIETFKRVSPSVANIQTTVTTAVSNGLELKPTEIPLGTGSGFLWDYDGHVVTNYHVVSAGRKMTAGSSQIPKTVKVKLSGMSQVVDADVVGVEPEKDLAVLKVRLSRSSLRKLPRPIDVGTSDDLQVGQTVLAIGNPFGLDDTLTKGIVSALGRDVDGIGGRPIHNCIQTDASINQGNSGGPLLDSSGRLIGVNTAIFSPGASAGVAGSVGIGFAIPVDTVRRVVSQIIQHGKVIRPTLGISVVDDRLKRSMEQQLGLELKGCLVAQVVPNSPAVIAGIEPTKMIGPRLELGDLITEIDGQKVDNAEDLISAVEEKHDGDVVTLCVQRHLSSSSGKARRPNHEYIKIKLTTRDKLESSSLSPPSASQFRKSTTGRRGSGTGSSSSSSRNMPWQ